MGKRAAILLLSVLSPLPAISADLGPAGPVGPEAPARFNSSVLRGSIGLRYWYSQSSYDLKVDGTSQVPTDGRSANSAELTYQLEDTSTGAFSRGYVGLGQNTGGDQSYYGLEADGLKSTALKYVTLDGGWQLAQLKMGNARIGGFLGYQYLSDHISARYSSQLFRIDNTWHAVRAGLSAEGDFTSRFGWSADVAAVPWAYHQVQEVTSTYTYGVEADAMLNVNLTPSWQVGMGGRYWWLKSNFEDTIVKHDDTYKRYGLLVEGKYTF